MKMLMKTVFTGWQCATLIKTAKHAFWNRRKDIDPPEWKVGGLESLNCEMIQWIQKLVTFQLHIFNFSQCLVLTSYCNRSKGVFMKTIQAQFSVTRRGPKTELLSVTAYVARLLLLLALSLPAAMQAQFNYTTNDGTVTITGYTGTGGDVIIPSAIDGLPVTRIGFQAFVGCCSMTSIKIPESVTNIDITVYFRASVAGAFFGCTSLRAITVDENNPVYSSIDGVLFDKSKTTLIEYPEGKAVDYTIPNGVTTIADPGFNHCSRLTSVTIPDSVTNIIGLYVFQWCSSLTNVFFKGNAPTIAFDWYVFSVADNVIVYYLPGATGWNTTFCGRPTEAWHSKLYTYTSTNGTVTITGYTGSGGDITIPSTIRGLPVTSIGDFAFYDCANLVKITIPSSVSSIGDFAFYDCANLIQITIPSSVSSIGAATFFCCSSLDNISIPDSVSNIGFAAFFGCGSLTSMNIPNSVGSIGGHAFYGCSNLTYMYFEGNAPSAGSDVFYGDNNLTVYYVRGNTSWGSVFCERPSEPLPFAYDTDVVCWQGWQSGGCYTVLTITAYTGSNGTVTIPSRIEGMPVPGFGDAFAGCTSVTNIIIPNSVGSLWWAPFHSCSSLMTITAEANNATYSSVDGVLFDNSKTTIVEYPRGRTESYTIPDTVNNIGSGAFYNCSSLTGITISTNVTSISANAFCGCTGLTNIVIPNSVTSICANAFSGCTGLTNIAVPNSVTSIGANAFSGCTSLTNIIIPNSVSSIGDPMSISPDSYLPSRPYQPPRPLHTEHVGAFDGCTNLSAIVVDAINSSYTSMDGVLFDKSKTTILEYPKGCFGSYMIPNSVTSIGDRAFYDCANLTSLTIPGSVTNIGSGAFRFCQKLASVYFEGNPPTVVGVDVFYGCNATIYHFQSSGWPSTFSERPTALGIDSNPAHFTYEQSRSTIAITGYSGPGEMVAIPEKINGLAVFSIGGGAFSWDTNLISITIPSSVTDIGNGAFSGCINLIDVYFKGDAPSNLGLDLFSGASNSTVYYQPQTEGWNPTFEGRPTALGMDPSNFTYQQDGTTVTITGYTGLCSVVAIPNNINGMVVTSIGRRAFLDCTNVVSLKIPNTVVSIATGFSYNYEGNLASFVGCSSLNSITVATDNSSYSSVDGVLFNKSQTTILECPRGKTGSYIIPNGVTNIEIAAFSECAGLTSITIPDSVTGIGNNAFWYCRQLVSVYFEGNPPADVGVDLFYGCNATIYHFQFSGWYSTFSGRPTALWIDSNPAHFTCEQNGSKIAITGYSGLGEMVVIPENINGLAVASIGDGAFSGATNLISITIPSRVTDIGNGAFSDCFNLIDVYFKGDAPSIVGLNPFFGASNSTVYYQPQAEGWNSTFGGRPTALGMDPSNFMYHQDGTTVTITGYTGPGGEVAIPNNINGMVVTSIGRRLVSDIYRQSIGAFSGCSNVVSVNIPNSVVSIATGYNYMYGYWAAFDGCTSLSALTVDADNATYSSVDGVLFDRSQKILILCPVGKAGSYTIPGIVTNIGSAAFYGCHYLSDVTMGTNVTSIEMGAFSDCTSMTNVNIGNRVNRLGTDPWNGPSHISVFDGCTNLSAITVAADNSSYSSVDGVLLDKSQSILILCPVGKAGSYIIPYGVTSINYAAFSECTGLISITIPDSVTNIGNNAFLYCRQLAAVFFEGNAPTSVEWEPFYGCNATIYHRLQAAGWSSTFAGRPTALWIDSDPAHFTCQQNGSTIAITGYSGAGGMAAIPDNINGLAVASIGDDAFSGITNLISITIPSSVTGIGNGAFSGCVNLIDVYFKGNAPTNVGLNPFSGATNATVYYLPGTSGWDSTFGDRPTMPWKLRVQAQDANFVVRANQFGFNINWAGGQVIVVEACTNLSNPVWRPLQTNMLTDDPSYFSDLQWTNYPGRFYRVRSQ